MFPKYELIGRALLSTYSIVSITVAAFKHLSELLPEEDKSLMNDNLSWLPLVAAVLTASCSVCFFMNMNYVKK